MAASRDEFNKLRRELKAFEAIQRPSNPYMFKNKEIWTFPARPTGSLNEYLLLALTKIEGEILGHMQQLVNDKNAVINGELTYGDWETNMLLGVNEIKTCKTAFDEAVHNFSELEKIKIKSETRQSRQSISTDNINPNLKIKSNSSQTLIDNDNDNVINVHNNLTTLTNHYLTAHRSDSRDEIEVKKYQIFKKLNDSLRCTPGTKYERLEAFKKELEKADKDPINRHRTDAWKRYLYNAFSFLTLIPAFARTISSYSKYHTFKFWKPESQKFLEYATQEIKKSFSPG